MSTLGMSLIGLWRFQEKFSPLSCQRNQWYQYSKVQETSKAKMKSKVKPEIPKKATNIHCIQVTSLKVIQELKRVKA
jgi:hypothetical protein